MAQRSSQHKKRAVVFPLLLSVTFFLCALYLFRDQLYIASARFALHQFTKDENISINHPEINVVDHQIMFDKLEIKTSSGELLVPSAQFDWKIAWKEKRIHCALHLKNSQLKVYSNQSKALGAPFLSLKESEYFTFELIVENGQIALCNHVKEDVLSLKLEMLPAAIDMQKMQRTTLAFPGEEKPFFTFDFETLSRCIDCKLELNNQQVNLLKCFLPNDHHLTSLEGDINLQFFGCVPAGQLPLIANASFSFENFVLPSAQGTFTAAKGEGSLNCEHEIDNFRDLFDQANYTIDIQDASWSDGDFSCEKSNLLIKHTVDLGLLCSLRSIAQNELLYIQSEGKWSDNELHLNGNIELPAKHAKIDYQTVLNLGSKQISGEFDGLDKDFLDLFIKDPLLSIKQGRSKGAFEYDLASSSIELKQLIVENLHINAKDQSWETKIANAAIDAKFNKEQKWELSCGSLQFYNARCDLLTPWQKITANDLSGNALFSEGSWKNADLNGVLKEHAFALKFADCKERFSIDLSVPGEEQMLSQVQASWQNEQLSGDLLCSGLSATFSIDFEKKTFSSADLKITELSLEELHPFWKTVLPVNECKGLGTLNLHLQRDFITVNCALKDLSMSHPEFNLIAEKVKIDQGPLVYYFATNTLSGNARMENANIDFHRHDLHFDKASLAWNKRLEDTKHQLNFHSSQLSLAGEFTAFKRNQNWEINFQNQPFNLDLSQIPFLREHFSAQVYIPENQLQVSARLPFESDQMNWQLSGEIEQGNLNAASIEEIAGKFVISSKEKLLELKNIQGQWTHDQHIAKVNIPKLFFNWKEGRGEGRARCDYQGREVASVHVDIGQHDDQFILICKGHENHILEQPLEKMVVHLNSSCEPSKADLVATINPHPFLDSLIKINSLADHYRVCCSYRADSAIIDLAISDSKREALNVRAKKSNDIWSIVSNSALKLNADFNPLKQDLRIQKLNLCTKDFAIELEGNLNLIDKKFNTALSCDIASPSHLISSLFALDPHLIDQSLGLEITCQGSLAEINGHFLCKERAINSLGWKLKQQSPAMWSYTKGQGIKFDESSFEITDEDSNALLCQWMIENCDFAKNCFNINAPYLFVSSAFLYQLMQRSMLPHDLKELCGQDLEGTLIFSREKNDWQVSGTLRDGLYTLQNKPFYLEKICWSITDQARSVEALLELEHQKLGISLTQSEEGYLEGNLYDPSSLDALAFHLQKEDGNWQSRQIEGEIAGIKAHFSLEDDLLNGRARIDLKRLITYLPASIAKQLKPFELGKGFYLEGNLDLCQPLHFEGRLFAKNFECCQLRLDQFNSELIISPNTVQLRNVRLEDRAGNLLIKQIEIKRNQEQWDLSIPLIRLQDFKPGLFTLASGKKLVDKPVVIRNMSIYDLNGIATDLKSIHGKGNLLFTTEQQNDQSLFDIPLELLKNIGVDWQLLTPIHGELDFEVSDGKLFFTALKESYSQGKRSYFYLKEPVMSSYLDLNGGLHIDLAMKQKVWLKLTQPFTLSIRGNLAKPQYSLQ